MIRAAYTRRLILVVIAAERDRAVADLLAAVSDAGPEILTAGLVPVGSAPGTAPTHYWSSWQMTEAELASVRSQFRGHAGRQDFLGVARDAPSTVEGEIERYPREVLLRLGLRAGPAR
ncbi:MAG: hypothetical protein HY909_31580 [Deltaproteobacteria bacterium]|nr:hypothetical protein [Deltaproteobacteria bacterium]